LTTPDGTDQDTLLQSPPIREDIETDLEVEVIKEVKSRGECGYGEVK
jgi:hypothetical protein